MNNRDRTLGMNRDISRRDFVNGVAMIAGSLALPLSALATEAERGERTSVCLIRITQCALFRPGDLRSRLAHNVAARICRAANMAGKSRAMKASTFRMAMRRLHACSYAH